MFSVIWTTFAIIKILKLTKLKLVVPRVYASNLKIVFIGKHPTLGFLDPFGHRKTIHSNPSKSNPGYPSLSVFFSSLHMYELPWTFPSQATYSAALLERKYDVFKTWARHKETLKGVNFWPLLRDEKFCEIVKRLSQDRPHSNGVYCILTQ